MTLRPWVPFAVLLLPAACASSSSGAARVGVDDVTTVRHVDRVEASAAPVGPTAPLVPLAGARCRAGACTCRVPGDDKEAAPPAEGMKRFEIRIGAEGGDASIESPVLGRFAGSGPRDTCFYIDVVAGSTSEFVFASRAQKADAGLAPRLRIAEYGPRGPWWYDVVSVECRGVGGRCDKPGASAWGQEARSRKRGRVDPCGSAVVTGLRWDTTGGQHDRDGGLYQDLTVRFAMELKKFATQFAPASTECVPK